MTLKNTTRDKLKRVSTPTLATALYNAVCVSNSSKMSIH